MLDWWDVALDLDGILALRDPLADLARAIFEDGRNRVLHRELRALEALARRPGHEDLHAERVSAAAKSEPPLTRSIRSAGLAPEMPSRHRPAR